jgi:hypothetical protein
MMILKQEQAKIILIKYSIFILLLIFSLLAGFNILKGVTQDSIVYSNYFNSISDINTMGDKIYFEYFYKLCTSFAKLILNLNYGIYASLLIFISLYIKYHLFSKRNYSFYLILSYLIIMYPMHESLALRAAFGISFVFLAFEYRDKKIISLLYLTIGILFHYSLSLMFAIWLFYNYFINKKIAVKFLALSFFIGILFYNIILHSSFVSQYIDHRLIGYVISNPNYFNIWSIPHVVLLSILSYLMYTNIPDNDFEGKDNLLIYMFIGSAYLVLSLIFFEVSMIYMRFIDIGMLGYYLSATNPNFRNKSLIRFIFVLVMIYEIMTKFLDIPYLVTRYII